MNKLFGKADYSQIVRIVRVALAVYTLLSVGHAFGDDEAEFGNSSQEANENGCWPSSPRDMLVAMDATSIMYNASILFRIRNDLVSGAAEEIGNNLNNAILALSYIAEHDECNATELQLRTIKRTLLMIAAINHKTSIPELTSNMHSMKVLENAIADDPIQFEKMLREAQQWQDSLSFPVEPKVYK